MRDELIALIEELIREILEGEGRECPALGPETALFGVGGLLDSMGIVTLVVALEQAIEDRHDVGIALADEKALSQRSGPYRTIASLADYASSVLEEAL